MMSLPARPRGRPRAFDEDAVLQGAIGLFSATGYSAAAVSDLQEATGLTSGSLYKAYRDKEGVFLKALERYIALREANIAEMLAREPNGRARIAALLDLYVRLSQGEEGRLGCLIVAGIGDLRQFQHAGEALRAQLRKRRKMLADLIAEGQADGSVAPKGEARTIADLLLSLLQGMRVVGKAGLFSEDGAAFVAIALKTLD